MDPRPPDFFHGSLSAGYISEARDPSVEVPRCGLAYPASAS